MAQLFFIYSTVNSGKSLELLKVANNYEQQDKKVLLFTSDKDDRNKKPLLKDQTGIISTRIGLQRKSFFNRAGRCFCPGVSKKAKLCPC